MTASGTLATENDEVAMGGAMTDEEYEPISTVAYRLDGEDGWRMAETGLDPHSVKAHLEANGPGVAEVRLIIEGIRRVTRPDEAPTLDGFGVSLAVGKGWLWDDVGECWRAPGEMITQPPGEPVPVDAICVSFEPAEYGWQPVCVAAGGRSALFEAGYLYDPFPVILDWLETLAVSREGRATANLENETLELLAFISPDPERMRILLSVVPGFDGTTRTVLLDIDVERWRFVSAVYGALRRYADSDRYDVEHFGSQSLHDALVHEGCPVDPVELATWPAPFLNELMWELELPDPGSLGNGWDPLLDLVR
jgi:hypothetical protein